MKITNVSDSNYKYGFKSTRQCVKDDLGRVLNCHYTNLNRADVNWKKFAALLCERFKTQKKVQINLYGCSDGSDAYTLAINLKKYLGKLASKFFPLKASDISPEIIAQANKGEILLHDRDLQYLQTMSAQDFFERDYTKPKQIMRGIDFYPYKVKPELRKCVNFSIKDVCLDSIKKNFSDEVFIFRNGWTFMSLDNQKKLINNLKTNSNKKSLFMIGQSDLFKSNACEFFQRDNFRGIETDVFTKAETDYPSLSIGMPSEKSKYPEFILFEKINN